MSLITKSLSVSGVIIAFSGTDDYKNIEKRSVPVSYTHLDVYKRQAETGHAGGIKAAPEKAWHYVYLYYSRSGGGY